MSNKTYDILKALAQIWLPLVATILIGIGEIWGVDILAPIGATLTMIDAAIGVALSKVSKDFYEEMIDDERD